jgi:hypothetical protein
MDKLNNKEIIKINKKNKLIKKSKYWKFECNNKIEFENSYIKLIPNERYCKKYIGNNFGGAMEIFNIENYKIIKTFWKIKEINKIKLKLINGYIEFNKPITKSLLLKKINGGPDFEFIISEKIEKIPENYKYQIRE